MIPAHVVLEKNTKNAAVLLQRCIDGETAFQYALFTSSHCFLVLPAYLASNINSIMYDVKIQIGRIYIPDWTVDWLDKNQRRKLQISYGGYARISGTKQNVFTETAVLEFSNRQAG
jgi:hypothetical protein